MLSCHFVQQIQCSIWFLENTNSAERRQSSLQALTALGALAPPRLPREARISKRVLTGTAGPCSPQRDRTMHWGFCIVGSAMVPFLKAKQKKPWVWKEAWITSAFCSFSTLQRCCLDLQEQHFLALVFGGGGGVNSHCLQEFQVGSLAQNSISISTLQTCLKIKNETLQVWV